MDEEIRDLLEDIKYAINENTIYMVAINNSKKQPFIVCELCGESWDPSDVVSRGGGFVCAGCYYRNRKGTNDE